MSILYFNTVNHTKISEIKHIFSDMIDMVRFTNYKILEPLSSSLEELAPVKVSDAYKAARVPVVVEHGALEIDYLNGLPGALSKPIWDGLGGKLCDLIPSGEDRGAHACSAVAYCDGFRRHTFIVRVPGTISEARMGSGGFQWDPIFIPDGSDLTYAQMDQGEKLRYSQAARAYGELRDYLGLPVQ